MLFKITLFALFLIFVPAAFACSCYPGKTVRQDYFSNSEVFTARVDMMLSGIKKPGNRGGDTGSRLIVEKVYKGSLKPGDPLTVIDEGHSCARSFWKEEIDKTFLLFKNSPDPEMEGYWTQSICERAKHIENAGEDLLYLDNIAEVTDKTRISGTIAYSEDSAIVGRPDIRKNLEGWKVTIRGNGIIRELLTDKNGVYEIYGLPSGQYSIELEHRKNWTVSWAPLVFDYGKAKPPKDATEFNSVFSSMFRVNASKKQVGRWGVFLFEGGHTSRSFEFGPDNSISGTIRGPNGKPIKDAELMLITAEGEPQEPGSAMATSDDVGNFEFQYITPGKYLIVVNNGDEVKSYRPFGKFYYPGTSDIKKAGTVMIDYGEKRAGINIRIPKFVPTVIVSGLMLYADGIPVARQPVTFEPNEEQQQADGSATETTDSHGRFHLTTFQGMKGTISPFILVGDKTYAKCPAWQKYIGAPQNYRFPLINKPSIAITANKNMSGLVIKLPFKSCKKAKLN